ncbi:MAG: hypothetical protein DFNUSKGM_003224, partial [Candidatus Fervidibacter sacchari]
TWVILPPSVLSSSFTESCGKILARIAVVGLGKLAQEVKNDEVSSLWG